ncbi:hypothetical protein NLU13_3484 [Sarocladium strictum]|uniref:Zn(2)-C6 fungal-type domain-containing protein n=1 Tax=Sarocladium strictum TaxID=5046 RepID=A0AA39L9T6_SARSR|nr:hypothetical protein NLU13_3484 [Sarocladium strictum]
MRPIKACLQCRTAKRKCDRKHGSACSQCAVRNIACSDSVKAVTLTPPPARLPLPPRASPVDEETILLVDLYFRFIHDQPHSLFHKPSLRSSVLAGLVSKPVLYGILGNAARFAHDPAIRARGATYIAKAKAALKDCLEEISLENIQACILIGNTCFGDCNADAESLYFVLAIRMCQILKLGTVNEADDGVTRETKRRIFWSCFIIDTWASGGSDLSRQFQWRANGPRLPMNEVDFDAMRPGDSDVPESKWRPGFWAYMVSLVEIYTKIMNFYVLLAETHEWDEAMIDEEVRNLDRQLTEFDNSLDPEWHFSPENLRAFTEKGIGSVFVAFHLGYHHYWTLLFYQYLDRRRPATRNGKAYSDRCKTHARIVCDILRLSRSDSKAPGMYNIVGHLTIVSSSVLLHTYLFGETYELEDAKRRLESNLESLVQLRGYWPSVELMIHRLVVFQKNCIWSMGRNTYRFDKWMVKFLIAHSLALEDKEEGAQMQAEALPDHVPGIEPLERTRITHSMFMDLQGADWNLVPTGSSSHS